MCYSLCGLEDCSVFSHSEEDEMCYIEEEIPDCVLPVEESEKTMYYKQGVFTPATSRQIQNWLKDIFMRGVEWYRQIPIF